MHNVMGGASNIILSTLPAAEPKCGSISQGKVSSPKVYWNKKQNLSLRAEKYVQFGCAAAINECILDTLFLIQLTILDGMEMDKSTTNN